MVTTVTATKKGKLICVMGKNPIKYKNEYITPARIIDKADRCIFDAIYEYYKPEGIFHYIAVSETRECLNRRPDNNKDTELLKKILDNLISGKTK